MPQQQALGPLQLVVEHVLGERAEVLEHLARDRLGADVLLADPRVPVGERVERLVDEVAQRLRVFELLELLHALLVLDAVRLHLRDRAVLDAVELLAQDQLGVLEDRLDQRQHVERVVGRLGVEQRERLEQIQRQRLVHREIVLQVDVDAQLRAVGGPRDELDDVARDERAEQLPRAAPVRLLRRLAARGSRGSAAASRGSRRRAGSARSAASRATPGTARPAARAARRSAA